MTFTDQELKLLKESLQMRHSIGPKTVTALIERLDKAEEALYVAQDYAADDAELLRLVKDWRKVCGK